ncbi:phage head-tail adapter protein [Cytobacillus kochii]|uniref:phage head-tail adapter protein n=1 Tax=Cytobacillus kochii TaxID=859143 RepID=UPI00402AE39D
MMIQVQLFKYKPPRVNTGDLRVPVKFYEYKPNDGPEPGEQIEKVLFECLAKVENVWMKDLEQAKTNGTVEDITITIRDPLDDYIPSNKHYVSVDARGYRDKDFNIKNNFPDPQNSSFIKVIAGITS